MASKFSFNFEIPNTNFHGIREESTTEQKDVTGIYKNKKAEVISATENLLTKVFTGHDIVTQSLKLPPMDNDVGVSLHYLSDKYAESLIKNSHEFSSSGTRQALELNTDLIGSLYEGGLKIWECSLDLVEFLHQSFTSKQLELDGCKVLELGCGAGLPGIYCLLNGATVDFQDYNVEVLKFFTMPNVALNLIFDKLPGISKKSSTICREPPVIFGESPTDNSGKSAINEELLESMQKRCQFISGDWCLTSSLIKQSSYDIILTSETIYKTDTQSSLYKLMKYSLKPNGIVLVAAKSYYFGVGGGTRQFEELVHNDGVFDISTVKDFSDGVKREILQMQIAS